MPNWMPSDMPRYLRLPSSRRMEAMADTHGGYSSVNTRKAYAASGVNCPTSAVLSAAESAAE